MLQQIAKEESTVPYPRVFWQSAFSLSPRLAWGYAEKARTLPSTLMSSWFGCHGFEPGQGWFFQPQEIREIPSSDFPIDKSRPLPRILERSDAPSAVEWNEKVNTVLEQIHKGHLKKVVLARSTTLTLSERVSPWDMLTKMREYHHPSTTLFLVQRSPATAFIGASPEKLYQRTGTILRTMAVAGTRRRSLDFQQDQMIRQELLASQKDRYEVDIVQRNLVDVLQILCDKITMQTDPTIMEADHLFHLHYPLQGELRPDIGDRYLLQLLHPTPALGGAPRSKALRLIKTLEPFRRGWYGAPLGWFSKDEADVAIGIRSALVQNNKVQLYAGAGIVTGSVPEKEWEELDNKIAGFINLWEKG